jgi:hypothetical protein
MVVDSTGDTVKVITKVDTIIQKENEVCVWERDLMGYPQLRCYKTNYPRSWMLYNNTPWWYRNDPFWYDYNRCPRYYYYDPSCGCCKYMPNNTPYRRDRDYYNRDDRNSQNSTNSTSRSPSSKNVPATNSRAPVGPVTPINPPVPNSSDNGNSVNKKVEETPVPVQYENAVSQESAPAQVEEKKVPRSIRSR